MTTFIIIGVIVGVVFSSIIGGILLKVLAKRIAKIDNVTFKNSFMISLISTILIGVFYAIVGFETILGFSIIINVLFNFLTLSVIYILVSKLIWKCSYLESLKANIIWIILFLIILILALSYTGQI